VVASSDGGAVKVTGLRRLARELKKAGVDLADLKKLGLAAAELVKQEAEPDVPRGATGRLAASMRVGATARAGFVRIGSASKVPYAGPIHFGWRKRNIRPRPFLYDALDARRDDIVKVYEDGLDGFLAGLDNPSGRD
jgi:hypothetical protein